MKRAGSIGLILARMPINYFGNKLRRVGITLDRLSNDNHSHLVKSIFSEKKKKKRKRQVQFV